MTAGTGIHFGIGLGYLPVLLLGLGVAADGLHRAWRASARIDRSRLGVAPVASEKSGVQGAEGIHRRIGADTVLDDTLARQVFEHSNAQRYTQLLGALEIALAREGLQLRRGNGGGMGTLPSDSRRRLAVAVIQAVECERYPRMSVEDIDARVADAVQGGFADSWLAWLVDGLAAQGIVIGVLGPEVGDEGLIDHEVAKAVHGHAAVEGLLRAIRQFEVALNCEGFCLSSTPGDLDLRSMGASSRLRLEQSIVADEIRSSWPWLSDEEVERWVEKDVVRGYGEVRVSRVESGLAACGVFVDRRLPMDEPLRELTIPAANEERREAERKLFSQLGWIGSAADSEHDYLQGDGK